jgi:hypothetical protein
MIVTGSFIPNVFYVMHITKDIEIILHKNAEFVVRQEVSVVANDRY